ncbi:hypothetical protein KY285_000726 [Solanum tuberosum]|nr:hypothetical protein KY285_000726 [Solanum tuberosum]
MGGNGSSLLVLVCSDSSKLEAPRRSGIVEVGIVVCWWFWLELMEVGGVDFVRWLLIELVGRKLLEKNLFGTKFFNYGRGTSIMWQTRVV